MLTRHTTLEDPWKKLKKPLEHYFLKRNHLKNHWKRIKRIWIQMQRENCSYQLRSQPRRSTSKFSIDREMNSYYPTSLFQFRFSLRCLVRLARSTKFLDRQCVGRSPKVSGGMLKTNYESNACEKKVKKYLFKVIGSSSTHIHIYIYIYNFTEVQVSRVIIVLKRWLLVKP